MPGNCMGNTLPEPCIVEEKGRGVSMLHDHADPSVVLDLSVTAVASMKPVDEEEWFSAIYVLALTDKIRIKVWSSRLHWRAGDCHQMMDKGRAAIHEKAKEWGMSLTYPSWSTFLESDWP